jgi:hypothetical protein
MQITSELIDVLQTSFNFVIKKLPKGDACISFTGTYVKFETDTITVTALDSFMLYRKTLTNNSELIGDFIILPFKAQKSGGLVYSDGNFYQGTQQLQTLRRDLWHMQPKQLDSVIPSDPIHCFTVEREKLLLACQIALPNDAGTRRLKIQNNEGDLMLSSLSAPLSSGNNIATQCAFVVVHFNDFCRFVNADMLVTALKATNVKTVDISVSGNYGLHIRHSQTEFVFMMGLIESAQW